MTSRSRFVLSLASTAFVLYLASGPLMRRALGDTGYTQLSIFHEVVSMIRDSYVDPVNMDRTLDAAESGLLEALDGDSGYLDADDFKILQSGKHASADTGIVLGRRFGFLTVVATRPGSPARKAGMKAGDFIKTIDGKHTHNLTVVKGERLLEGEPGTTVSVAIFKSGTEAGDNRLVRERPAPTFPVAHLLDGGVGYIAVADVGDGMADALKAAISSLQAQGAHSLVLDLRNSATGPLKNAVPLAELFIKSGVVTKLAARNAPEQTLVANNVSSPYDGPLAILVDRGTAGATEIAAACLLDAKRATLFGENTFGRAGIQKQIPLDSGGGLLLTVSRYLTPKGEPINGKGLTPKNLVRNPESFEAIGAPGKDPVLDKALESLKTTAQKAAA
ncbi:MAG: PDZ domain-containing protein [Vicinamibacteria bacterium]|nr:PDZ domain-containing protein [Vicinamibacteria bacterium]